MPCFTVMPVAVFVYSMGLTQHEFGVDNVKAIVNLALSRGMLGRDKCGIMPMRGHSGDQGGGECGAEPDKFQVDFQSTTKAPAVSLTSGATPFLPGPGLRVPEMIEAASNGDLDFLYSIGGNLLETMPDRNFIASALEKVAVRVHQDIVLNSSMLLDAKQAVLILPGQTRYEQRGGGTTTSTERRIRFTLRFPDIRLATRCRSGRYPPLSAAMPCPTASSCFPMRTRRASATR